MMTAKEVQAMRLRIYFFAEHATMAGQVDYRATTDDPAGCGERVSDDNIIREGTEKQLVRAARKSIRQFWKNRDARQAILAGEEFRYGCDIEILDYFDAEEPAIKRPDFF